MTVNRWQRPYLQLVVLRHASAITGLLGFVLLASASLPSSLRSLGAILLGGGWIGFALSLVAVGPLVRRRLGRPAGSLVEFSSTGNELTGHGLVAEATASEPEFAWLTRSRLHVAMAVEAVLFVTVPAVAALTA